MPSSSELLDERSTSSLKNSVTPHGLMAVKYPIILPHNQVEAKIQLITMTMPGDVHHACEDLTRLGLAHLLVCVTRADPSQTTVVLRTEDDDAPRVRALLGWPDPANKPYYRMSVDERWIPPRHRS